ncbi:MAG: hypothetical protein ACJ79K_17960 [Gemmatimonadaceae bacterium]
MLVAASSVAVGLVPRRRCLTARSWRVAQFALVVVLAPLARTAQAQADTVTNPHIFDPGSCVSSLGDSAFTRTPVYARVAMRSPIPQRVPALLANVLQAVVDRADSALGSPPPYLPNGEPAVDWRTLGGGLLLTWHRDGRLTWTVRDDSTKSAAPTTALTAAATTAATVTSASASTAARDPSALARLFGRAIDATVATGEVFLAWPRESQSDSVQFDIDFERARVNEQRKLERPEATLAIPMLSVRAPWETPVRVLRKPARVDYPFELQQRGVRATVLVSFIVDTTGVADPSTIRDAWPPWRPRLTGQLAKYYDQFYDAAVKSIGSARFAPATIAGCKVRVRVEQPFTWQIAN